LFDAFQPQLEITVGHILFYSIFHLLLFYQSDIQVKQNVSKSYISKTLQYLQIDKVATLPFDIWYPKTKISNLYPDLGLSSFDFQRGRIRRWSDILATRLSCCKVCWCTTSWSCHTRRRCYKSSKYNFYCFQNLHKLIFLYILKQNFGLLF
jgi:hypothetical protein